MKLCNSHFAVVLVLLLATISYATPSQAACEPLAAIVTLPPNATVEPGETIFFLGGASSDPCAEGLTYRWDLGDGLAATTRDASRSYAQPGKYPVALTVCTTSLLCNTSSEVVTIGLPRIDGYWPGAAAAGTFIYVFGKNFVPRPGMTQVCVNSICTPLVHVYDQGMLIFVLPAGNTAGPITVTTRTPTGPLLGTPIGTASTNPPIFGETCTGLAIRGVWPSEAKRGSVVYLFGCGFTSAMRVDVNGVSPLLTHRISNDLLLFFVPMNTPLGQGQVCVSDGTQRACGPINIVP